MGDFDISGFVTELSEQGYWLRDSNQLGFEDSTAQKLFSLAHSLKKEGQFRLAHIGKGHAKRLHLSIRRDEICWITDWSDSLVAQYCEFLCALQLRARRELFLSIKRFEAHFSVYPPGAFYKPHVDRHHRFPSRVLTVVLYLNDMELGEGGELNLYPKGRIHITIRPQQGHLVVFDSRLKHEVLPALKERWSLTAWLRDDQVIGIEGV